MASVCWAHSLFFTRRLYIDHIETDRQFILPQCRLLLVCDKVWQPDFVYRKLTEQGHKIISGGLPRFGSVNTWIRF
jgi:hypothetical protein